MTMVDNEVNDTSVCANCGKEGANNICKCKMVKYCNAVCKKVHKKKHKKDCEEHIRLATEKHNEELRIAAELHDEQLSDNLRRKKIVLFVFNYYQDLKQGGDTIHAVEK